MSAESRPLLPEPILCLITQREYARVQSLPALIKAAVDGGVNMIHIREKGLAQDDLLTLAHQVREVTQGKALLFLNQQVEVALACGADGIHLAERGMSVESVRRQAGDELLIGRSVHSVDSARKMEAEGANFLIVGTIFPTASKPGGVPAGLDLLSRVATAVTIPYLAIGGINVGNVEQVMRCGSSGIAAISAILGAADPTKAANDIAEKMRWAYVASRNSAVAM